jgi:Rod binding domain-containing protein
MTIHALEAIHDAGGLKPKDAAEAAREFEALWIEQMLKSARPQGEAEDSTRDMALDMADQQIARLLASGGGFGLAKLVSEGLRKKPATASQTNIS